MSDHTNLRMSEYEQRAWKEIKESVDSRKRSFVPARARDMGVKAGRAAKELYSKVPGSDAISVAVNRAMEGLQKITTNQGMRSVDAEKYLTRYGKSHPHVHQFEDVRSLDLSYCDKIGTPKRTMHSIAGLAEGAASSLAITGATVSTTVSGGVTAGVAIGAIAADVALVLAGTGRIVGEVAACYGYDVREPEEELYALPRSVL